MRLLDFTAENGRKWQVNLHKSGKIKIKFKELQKVDFKNDFTRQVAVQNSDRKSQIYCIKETKLVITCLATAFAKSLQVSVFPVPAGPSGAPPKFSFRAPIKVLRILKCSIQ